MDTIKAFIHKLLVTLLILLCFHNNVFPQSWKYLGQSPPGMVPVKFAPEILLSDNSWWWHSTAVFSPNGEEMFFSKYFTSTGRMQLEYLAWYGGEWVGPQLPSFADTTHSMNSPIYSKGGDSLYFVTTEPPYHIMLAIRETQGWNTPVPVNITYPSGLFPGYQFSIAKDHSIYLEMWENNQVDLYYAKYTNGAYELPIPISELNTSNYDWCPFIDPDDNYLIFCSNRPGGFGLNDIYISTKTSTGSWSVPKNLGSPVNSSHEDIYPQVSVDDQYISFIHLINMEKPDIIHTGLIPGSFTIKFLQ